MHIHCYWVYILTNPSKTVFYTGFTGNLARRLEEHLDASLRHDVSTFTGRYNCCHLVYFEAYQWAQEGIAREKELKKFSRRKKLDLIRSINPDLQFLESMWNTSA